METIRTAALTTLAIVACLVLLLTPDSRREEAPTGGALPAAQKNLAPIGRPQIAMRLEREPRAIPARNDTLSPAGDQPESLAAPPAESPTLDWLETMYPELARIEALENQPANTALGELVPMLGSEDPVVRLAAIEALGDMTLPGVANALLPDLGDPDPLLRVAALEALAAQEDASVASSIEPYLYDPELEVRLAAIDAISELESEGSVYALAGLLSDPDSRIRQRAVYALGEFGGNTSKTYLLQARYDPVESIRFSAAAIIAELEYDAAY